MGLLERQKDKKCVTFQVERLSQYINTDEGTAAKLFPFLTKTGDAAKQKWQGRFSEGKVRNDCK